MTPYWLLLGVTIVGTPPHTTFDAARTTTLEQCQALAETARQIQPREVMSCLHVDDVHRMVNQNFGWK